MHKCYLILLCIGPLGCQEQIIDKNKIYDQKYIDSTLFSISDSLNKLEIQKFDSLLKVEAELLADSLMNLPKRKPVENIDVKAPQPLTPGLPEPTGPDYQFPQS